MKQYLSSDYIIKDRYKIYDLTFCLIAFNTEFYLATVLRKTMKIYLNVYRLSKQKDIDVLIIHNPPYEILDESIGCKTLIKIVKEINTKLLIFGHMHSCSDSNEIHNKI